MAKEGDPNLPRHITGTPEQHLGLAVILQAIEDLDSKDETIRFEAHEFWLHPDGPWADMRRYFFDMVGLDDEHIHKVLTSRLDAPERPERKWTHEEVLDHLPRHRAFAAKDVCDFSTLHPSQAVTRLHHLKIQKRIVGLGRGLFCFPEFEATWRAEQSLPEPKHTPFVGFDAPPRDLGPTQKLVYEALQNGRRTVREIGWDVPRDFNALQCALNRLVQRDLVIKQGSEYRPAPKSSVVAATK